MATAENLRQQHNAITIDTAYYKGKILNLIPCHLTLM